MTNHFHITYKRSRDSQKNPIVPPKIKQVYKAKEKVVEHAPIVQFIPLLREKKKPMVDKPAPTQKQLENHTKRNINERGHRHRCHAITQSVKK
jgi:hypothetical protein